MKNFTSTKLIFLLLIATGLSACNARGKSNSKTGSVIASSKFMDFINPVPLYIYGANINRQTYDNLLKADFEADQIKVENIWCDIVKIIRIDN
ncbi:hypothetical protein [Anaerophaga thermohalophila]|jgi:ABC-type glycerol-3-phosphate transport system substrate-binding protein|uniref:hypothetical protein n=1 Tax=Anaerophaga thermohalophila TaxID=177400 RepID=UPI0002F904A1|nr:hypothetical protein [Anaerophaga thermohalophila]